jgi:hypothetical protein
MATFRPDEVATPVTVTGLGGVPTRVRVGDAGRSALSTGEARVRCPKCGSPYIATFSPGDPKFSGDESVTISDARMLAERDTGEAKPFALKVKRAIPGLTCSAGDCGYAGPAGRID